MGISFILHEMTWPGHMGDAVGFLLWLPHANDNIQTPQPLYSTACNVFLFCRRRSGVKEMSKRVIQTSMTDEIVENK